MITILLSVLLISNLKILWKSKKSNAHDNSCDNCHEVNGTRKEFSLQSEETQQLSNEKDFKYNLEAGTIIKDKYVVIEKLGKGGMGQVYLCKSLTVGNLWAVKFIPKSPSNNAPIVEASILKKLNHIYLPKIADVFYEDSGTYIVESYIEGIPLDRKMEKEGPFDEDIVLEWGKQLLEVLSYLHSLQPNPIIYCDMKPSNVIITHDNVATLIDFGISKEYENEGGPNTPHTLLSFTTKYAAPEQLLGYSDQRTDIYNLSIMLLSLLTDIEKKELKNNWHALKNMSKPIKEVLLKAADESAKKRFQTVGEFKEALINVQRHNTAKINYIKELPADYKKIIGIYSPYAVGKTTIACNLASAYAKSGNTVALIDTDDLKKDIQYHFSIDYAENLHKLARLHTVLKENRDIKNIKDYCINKKNLEIYTDHRDTRYEFNFEMIDTIIKNTDANLIIIDISSFLDSDLRNKILTVCNERLLIIDKTLSNILGLPVRLYKLDFYNNKNMSLVINKNIETKKISEKDVLGFLNSVEIFGVGPLNLSFKNVFKVPHKYKEIIECMLHDTPTPLYGRDREFDGAIDEIAYSLYQIKHRKIKKGLLSRLTIK